MDEDNMELPPPVLEGDKEYIVVSDKNDKVVLSTTNWYEALKLAGRIRKCGGECTIFAATKG